MIAQWHDSLLTPTTILWAVASLAATALLFGSMTRRRTGLTESLRTFISRNVSPADGGDADGADDDEGPN